MTKKRRRTAPRNADLPNPNAEGHELPQVRDVPVEPASVAVGYEVHDVQLRPIYWFTGALLLAILVLLIVLFWLVQMWTGEPLTPRVEMRPAMVVKPDAPGPGLEVAPERELAALLAQEQARLTGSGWTNHQAGTVYVPIDQAMQMLVEQGVAARQGYTPTFRLSPAYQLDGSGGLQITADEQAGGGGTGAGNTPGATEETGAANGAAPAEQNAAGEGTGGDVTDGRAPGATQTEEPSDATPAEENASGEGTGGDVTTPGAPGEVQNDKDQ